MMLLLSLLLSAAPKARYQVQLRVVKAEDASISIAKSQSEQNIREQAKHTDILFSTSLPLSLPLSVSLSLTLKL